MKFKQSSNQARVTNVDIVNVILIFVVLLLHHVNYTQDYLWAISHRVINPYDSGISQILQKFAVGGFLFLSGFKLALTKQSEPTKVFLLNRFLRIYPLYLLAVILFSVTVYPHANGKMPSPGNFVVHALALQSWLPNLYQENYLTIWFVSNLFFCYLMFVFLRRYLFDTRRFLLATSIVVLVIHLAKLMSSSLSDLKIFSGHFDTYFIFFAAGMLYSHTQVSSSDATKEEKIKCFVFLLICAILFIVMNLFLSPDHYTYPLLERLFLFGFTLPAFHLLLKLPISTLLTQSGDLNQKGHLVSYISSASLCIFLFHRPVWSVMSMIMPNKSYLQSLFILGIGIPFIFIASYHMQRSYNARVTLFLRSIKQL